MHAPRAAIDRKIVTSGYFWFHILIDKHETGLRITINVVQNLIAFACGCVCFW